jgi:hypothetical protein
MGEAMTDEEYLRARGWERGELSTGKVFWRKHGQRMPSLAEAVETQLAEDRDCYNFVRAHTRMHGGYLWPQEGPPDDIGANRPR